MKKYYAIVIAVCMLLSMSACQPTPEREVVIGKDTDILEQAVKATVTPQTSQEPKGEPIPRYEAPERWEANYEKYNGRFKMAIDAEVVVSDATAYPVVKIKPYYIPIEQADKMVKAIFGDQVVYHNQMNMTKDQLESMIIDAKAEKKKAEKDKDDERVKIEQSVIDHLIAQLSDAPEEATLRPYIGEYDIYKAEDSEQHSLALRLNPLDKETPVLQVQNAPLYPTGNGYNSWASYENCMQYRCVYFEEEDTHWDYHENPMLQTDEAKAAMDSANTFIESIGIEDMVIHNMYALTKDYGSKEILGYRMEYGRMFNDTVIPPNVGVGGKTSRPENEFVCRFDGECLSLEIEGDAITRFEWYSMYQMDETLIEDVELLPFEEIMANAENQLAVKYAYMEDREDRWNVFVDKIILTYTVEQIRNERYQYMLVPVWAFYGGDDYGDGYEFSDGSVRKGWHHSPMSLLTVNAIDGSIIGG